VATLISTQKVLNHYHFDLTGTGGEADEALHLGAREGHLETSSWTEFNWNEA
jgi:hypothetical protein